MQNNQVLDMTPTTPASVLGLFTTAKQSIAFFAASIINEVEDGKIDPLKVHTLCKAMTETADKIIAGIKENVKIEAAKYGEKPFMFNGCELHNTSVKTEYDYEVCGDWEWEMLNTQMAIIKKQMTERQEWLKTMGSPQTVINKLTGEICEIVPPMKRTSMGVKCTIK